MKLPNGYGSITKLTGKRRNPFMVRIRCTYTAEDGTVKEQRSILGYYHTRTEAMQALADYNKSPYDVSENVTFGELYNKWVATKKGKSALALYKTAFSYCSSIQDTPMTSLRLSDFQGILDANTDKSRSMLNAVVCVLHGVNAYAMMYDIIPKDYSQYIKIVDHAEAAGKHKVFTESEIDDLWGESTNPVRDITLILIYSGWRCTELLELSRIDLDEMIMQGGKKTEAGKDRIVPIHKRILPLLKKYIDGFPIAYQTYYTHIRERYHHIPHDTRHTFISRMQTAGADKICIERLVGHVSKGVTDKIYTHKDIDELKKNIDLLK